MGNDKNITPSKVTQLLDWTYDKVITGLPGARNIYDYTNDYKSGSKDNEAAIRSVINWAMIKTGSAGFVTGLGGLITLPVAVPADVASSLYVNMRMVAAIALLRGYDLKSDQVRTMVYVTLTGETVKDVLKSVGIKLGESLTNKAIQKYLTRDVIKSINKAVGSRFLTKAGEKGVINATKMVPLIGGFVSAGFDAVGTKTIAKAAKASFTAK